MANACGKFRRTAVRAGGGIGSTRRLQAGLRFVGFGGGVSYDDDTSLLVSIPQSNLKNAEHMQLSYR